MIDPCPTASGDFLYFALPAALGGRGITLSNRECIPKVWSVMFKKWLKWGSVAFVAWYNVKQPDGAASVVQGALNGLGGAADSLSTFMTSAIP